MAKPHRITFRHRNFGTSLSRLLNELDTPLALRISSLLRANTPSDNESIVRMECDPRQYTDVDCFRSDYFAVNLLKKCEFLKTGIDVEQVARDNLAACEQHNRVTNRRFLAYASHPDYSGETASVLETARRKIAYVLGSFDIDECLDACRWGPGSSTSVKFADATPEEKFRAGCAATPHALSLFGDVFKVAYPLWSSTVRYWEIHAGNQVTFVNKNAKTKRSIAKEPDFNLWFQLAVGKMIRRRMTKVGIDLNTQANNQSAAWIGSITRQIATVDVKDASNTLAYGPVNYLVSDTTWFSVLDALRSHYGTLGDTTSRWEMFSSMGNGFTFELETLIFWALASASCEVAGFDPCVWVFGDDITCPDEVVPILERVMRFCGFQLNVDKSYWGETPFRESCGVHYWDGEDCQPLYIKSDVTTAPEAYRLANRLRAASIRLRSERIRRACVSSHRSLVLGVPPELRYGVPRSAGDAGFWVHPSDDAVLTGLIEPHVDLTPYHEFGWEGFYVTGFSQRTRYSEVNHVGVLMARLHGLSSAESTWEGLFSDKSSMGSGNLSVLREPGVPEKVRLYARGWGAPPQGGF